MAKTKLFNADIPRSISAFQAVMKEFLLKYKLYRLLIRGKGLEFVNYRAYAPDDDATTIDWKASKRSNSLLVKQYRDERNLKIVFIIDVGENMVFGSTDKLKCEYGAEVIAAFSHLIISSGDKTGYLLFSNEIKKYVKPGGGRMHFAHFMSDISNPEIYGLPSDMNKAIEFALSYINKNVQSVVIVSDFANINKNTGKKLALLGKKFETLALVIRDPRDTIMPADFSGEIVLEDPETGQQILVNPKLLGEVYRIHNLEQQQKLRKVCLENHIDILELSTSEPFVPSLSEFLKRRIQKKF